MNKKNPKIRKKLKVSLIVIIAIITMIRGIKSIEPSFNRICEKEANGIATKITSNKATEVMKKYEYDDLVTIMKDENGNVNMVKANIIPINKIISDVAVEIQNELDNLSDKDVEIKLGSFTGIRILSGRGPSIKFKILSVGDVFTDFKSEFKSAGINQTLHRMYLEVKCNVSILTPFNSIDKQITNQVIIGENIIVGTTPNTYYNFDNLTNTDSVIETIE